MVWEAASYLWALLIIPVLVIGFRWYNRRRRDKRRRYFGDSVFESLVRNEWQWGKRIKELSLYVALAFFVVALAGPKVGTEVREVKRRGIDMLIALDLSSSMNAEDVRPSRLDKAKYEIGRLIDRLKGDRVGLIVFTGEAYLQSPMTLDYSALRLFLNIVDTDQMPSSTTDFSAPMETAQQAFESAKENQSNAAKVLLIISDGEHHGQSFDGELETLTENNISVYTLGIGTTSGTTIPVYNEDDNLMGYKRDKNGQVITTELHRDVLQEIARNGNGEYYEIQTGSGGIDAFLGRIDELEKGEFASQEYADFKNQYQLLAGIGLFFLALSILFPGYRKN